MKFQFVNELEMRRSTFLAKKGRTAAERFTSLSNDRNMRSADKALIKNDRDDLSQKG